MRRTFAYLLIGVAACFLVLAPLLRFWVVPTIVKAPLDQFTETVSEAPGATYLDTSTLSISEGRTLVATRTVRGDVAAGSDDTAVWDVFVKVVDPDKAGESAQDRIVTATTDRVAFDRRTQEAVSCCGEALNGSAAEHEGIEYKFPFGAEKKTYQYFDTTIGRATPMEYQGSETIQGVNVYRYEQRIEPEAISELDVPGSLIGSTEASVPVERFYSNTRRVWVEPDSGVIVKGQEQQFSTLRDDSGEDVLTVTEATLTFNDRTVRNQADTAKDAARQISLLGAIGPLVLLLLGLIALVAGVVLA
ncbi:MAG: DUF3068 domain-containing protein, partial [Actinomycetes bacterium]